jgi:hypothetical protein
MILTGEIRRTRRKACRSASLSTTYPTCTALEANPGLRGHFSYYSCFVTRLSCVLNGIPFKTLWCHSFSLEWINRQTCNGEVNFPFKKLVPWTWSGCWYDSVLRAQSVMINVLQSHERKWKGGVWCISTQQWHIFVSLSTD